MTDLLIPNLTPEQIQAITQQVSGESIPPDGGGTDPSVYPYWEGYHHWGKHGGDPKYDVDVDDALVQSPYKITTWQEVTGWDFEDMPVSGSLEASFGALMNAVVMFEGGSSRRLKIGTAGNKAMCTSCRILTFDKKGIITGSVGYMMGGQAEGAGASIKIPAGSGGGVLFSGNNDYDNPDCWRFPIRISEQG